MQDGPLEILVLTASILKEPALSFFEFFRGEGLETESLGVEVLIKLIPNNSSECQWRLITGFPSSGSALYFQSAGISQSTSFRISGTIIAFFAVRFS